MTPEPRWTRRGAVAGPDGTRFSVWAPGARQLELHIVHPFDKVLAMQPSAGDVFRAHVPEAGPGSRYLYRIDGGDDLPDPASTFQPEGVHGPSEVTRDSFAWTDDSWRGRALADLVICEVHVGTFTPEGTFDAAIGELDRLASVGFTAVELMPVAQFPGSRNWGYDGVFPYAVQDTYGGPDGLRRLVDAAHARGVAVVVDVVHNHLGPEGCVVDRFGPYFTDRYSTPWGRAVNFDDRGSDEVRRFFIASALRFLDEFHVDALRLDAVHAIADNSAFPFLEELAVATDELRTRLEREIHLIAESAANDARLVTPRAEGGIGHDAQWNDDLHHALIALVTGERDGYFADYGEPAQLARALAEGFVFQDDHSRFRGRRFGRRSGALPPDRLVAFSSNHDQVGNRARGDRPGSRLSFEQLKLLAGVVLLSPYIPLVFMGEEYGETAPFAYFVSHSDPQLVEAVRRGRREEFAGFAWTDEIPDPGDPATFDASKIDPSLGGREPNATLLRWYTHLMRLRRETLAVSRSEERDAIADGPLIRYSSRAGRDEVLVLINASDDPQTTVVDAHGTLLVDSSETQWRGPGGVRTDGDRTTLAPMSLVAYARTI